MKSLVTFFLIFTLILLGSKVFSQVAPDGPLYEFNYRIYKKMDGKIANKEDYSYNKFQFGARFMSGNVRKEVLIHFFFTEKGEVQSNGIILNKRENILNQNVKRIEYFLQMPNGQSVTYEFEYSSGILNSVTRKWDKNPNGLYNNENVYINKN